MRKVNLKKKIEKKILSLVLAFAMVITMVPMFTVTAAAADKVSGIEYIDAGGFKQTSGECTVVTSGATTWTGGWYVADSTITIESTVTCSGDVHLILVDGVTLAVYGSEAGNGVGICVSGEGNSLTIYGQSGQTGELKAFGQMNSGGAGIGGGNGGSGSNIKINGGYVQAESRVNTTAIGGAGIGGGNGGNGSNITVNGGVVEAKGAAGGAGIGGGNSGSGSNIKINGGTVRATGSGTESEGTGAGIGSGVNGGAASEIYAAADWYVMAGTSDTSWTKIDHTNTQDIAATFAGKAFVAVMPGTLGGCTWFIDSSDSGTLTITPASISAGVYESGKLPDGILKKENWPWYGLRLGVKKVVVSAGVKSGDSLAYMFGSIGTNAYDNLKEVNISNLDFSQTCTMESMFQKSTSLETITWPSEPDTSNVENMSCIFSSTKVSAMNRITYMNTLLQKNKGKCTNWTAGCFSKCNDTEIDLTALNMVGVTDMSSMFTSCESLKTIKWPSNFDTSLVTNMDSMFSNCKALTSLDLSGFDTSQVTNMSSMFSASENLKTIYVSSKWSTEKVFSSGGMFYGCTSLVGGAGTKFGSGHTDATYARIDGGPESETPGYLTLAVAQMNGNGYTSVQTAVDAAISEAAIKMMADSPENVTIGDKNIKLNLNDKTLAGSDGVTLSGGPLELYGGTVKPYVKGTGHVTISGITTIQAIATGGSDNGGLKADGGTLTVNVKDGATLNSNIIASGSANKVVMTADDATIHGTEYAEIFVAKNGGAIQVNTPGAVQNLKIKSEINNNQGLSAVNADLDVYGLESLDVTRTTANKGVNGVYAGAGSNVIINTTGDALNTTVSVKGGPTDENTQHNAAAMALYSTWYTGSGENKTFSTLNANGIKSVKAENTGLYGQAYAVYETFGSTLNVNSTDNTTAIGEISSKADYYSVGVTAAGGNVNIYGIKDISTLATGNQTHGVKGIAIGVSAYGETTYSSPNSKAYLTINSAGAAHDTSISAKSTSDDDPDQSEDAYAIGVYTYKEAAAVLNGIKDITSEAKGAAYGIYSYSTTPGKVNDVDIDMAGTLSANTTDDGGQSNGLYSLYYSDVDIEGNGTAEIKAVASGNNSGAYGIVAMSGAGVTLNNIKSITASGLEAYAVYANNAAINIISNAGIVSQGTTAYAIYAEDGSVVNITNAAITGDIYVSGASLAFDGDVYLKNSKAAVSDFTNNGTMYFDMTDETAAQVKLIDYTGSGTADYGTSEFAAGKDNGYTLQVIDGDLCAVTPVASVTSGSDVTNYDLLSTALGAAASGDTVTLLTDATEEGSITVNAGITLDTNGKTLKTSTGWTLKSGSITYTDSIINGDDPTAILKTGTVNGAIYAPSGTLDLRGVDLRLKGEPTLYGGSVTTPTDLDTLKATRVFFGDIYDGGNTQTIKNIILENCTTALQNYRAALGVYYDTLTVDNVSVNATQTDWYWNQQYQPVNYQMYTGFGGTLNIIKSLTTGEYINAGYSVGGTGITNLSDGAILNCVDFQNTGNSKSGVTAEQAAQNIANGIVNVNGSGATLNAAALNNHAITDFGTVNLTSHPTVEGLYNVNYGTGAVLTIGALNFLNQAGDSTKEQFRVGDNAKTIIGGLTTNPEVGTDFYVTQTSDTKINAEGGGAVQFTGNIVFTTYADAESTGAKVSLNLDSSDDYFTGSVQGTQSTSNRWGKWGSAVNGNETAYNDGVQGMTLTMSNGAIWNITKDSIINTLSVLGSNITGEHALTVASSTDLDATAKITVSDFTNSGIITVDMTGATALSIKLIDCSGTADYGTYDFATGKDCGYVLQVIDGDLCAVKTSSSSGGSSSGSSSSTVTVPVSGDKETVKIQATVSGTNATVKNVTTEEIAKLGTGSELVIDLTSLNKSVTGVTIPRTSFENVAASEADGLEIKMPNGTTAKFDKEVLSAVASQAQGANIQLVIDKDSKAENSMTSAQKETVKEMNNAVVLDAYFVSNGQRISDFKGGEADITATYETANPVRVWYVADDGVKTLVPSTYDGKVACFTVSHFSHYVIEQLDGSSYDACPQDSTCAYAKFTDADTKAWYHDGVHFCVENGYMNGVSSTQFAPDGTLSRAMIVTILWNMEEKPVVNYSMTFDDVAEDQWYTEAIRWAQSTGVVSGYDEYSFGPEDNVTREQLAAILWRYAKYKGYDVSVGEDTNILSYDDAIGGISDWAMSAMQWACGAGIINGIGTKLEARGNATRAQAACMVQRFYENTAK